MGTLLFENVTGDEYNMSRVNMEPKLQVNCVTDNSSIPSTCGRPSQASMSTPILMTTFGVLGNVLALIVLYSSRREAQARRTVFFVMLSGLAWTDLIGQFAVSPIAIIVYANNLTWVGGTPLCRYHGFMMVSFGIVMPLIVCCMSVERFLAIKFSYYYARHITRRKAQLTFLACWCVTVTFTAMPFVGFGSYELQFPHSWCFLNFHRESMIDTIYAAMFSSLNIIAIFIMILCNLLVTVTLVRMRRSRQLHSSPSIDRRLSVSGVGSTTSGTVIRPKHRSDMEAQMIWFLGLITIAFSVCWLPLNVHILIMQFTGTTNMVLDLQFIRLVSCNQILDPWLYVIFRKNSLLRIFRRVKACYSNEPPKPCPARPPGLRYVMGNKSFICEASTVGRTFVGAHRINKTAPLCRHFIKQRESKDRPNCKDSSSESSDQLVSACSHCNGESFSQSSSSPLADLTLGMSPSDSRPKSCSYDTNEIIQNVDKSQRDTEHLIINSTAHDTPERQSAPKSSQSIQKKLVKDLDTSANELNDIYYSFDSGHEPYIVSSKMSHKQKDTSTMPARKTSFLESLINSPNSPTMSLYFPETRPWFLKLSPEPHLLVSPPLASPERLADTPPKTGSQDNLTSVNIPAKNRGDHISNTLRINGHIESIMRNQPPAETNHRTSNSHLCFSEIRKPESKNVSDNVHLSNGDEKLQSNGASTSGKTEQLPNNNREEHHHKVQPPNNREQLHHKVQPPNGAPTDLQISEPPCLMSSRPSSSPLKAKFVTFPGKFCNHAGSGQISQSHRDSLSEVKLGACHHSNTDHTDHIKCFRAKKTPYFDKTRTVGHHKGIRHCENGIEPSCDSRT